MKTSQKRAIFYAERKKKLEAIEKMGLMDEYREFNKGKRHHTIAWFCKSKGITL